MLQPLSQMIQHGFISFSRSFLAILSFIFVLIFIWKISFVYFFIFRLRNLRNEGVKMRFGWESILWVWILLIGEWISLWTRWLVRHLPLLIQCFCFSVLEIGSSLSSWVVKVLLGKMLGDERLLFNCCISKNGFW